jgi:hypothetical protein
MSVDHEQITRDILLLARHKARMACSTIEDGLVHCTAVSDLPFWWNSAVSSHAVDDGLSPEIVGI